MHYRYSLRSIFIVASLFALWLSLHTFIFRVVIPENIKTAKTLCNAIGAEYEQTGLIPRGSLLKWSDIKQDYGLAIHEAVKTGYTTNCWGEEIGLIVVPINDPNGTQELYLEVVARGPFGIGYASCGNSFRHNASELGTDWQGKNSQERTANDLTARQKMLGDVVTRILPDSNRTTVEKQLGAPDNGYFTELKPDLLYCLGPQREGMFKMDSEWLAIWFSRKGTVDRWAILTD